MDVERHRLLSHVNVPAGHDLAVNDNKVLYLKVVRKTVQKDNTFFTCHLCFVTAIDAVDHSIAERVLWQTLTTFASKRFPVAGNS